MSNPVLKQARFETARRELTRPAGQVMTKNGVLTATGVLLALVLVGGAVGWTVLSGAGALGSSGQRLTVVHPALLVPLAGALFLALGLALVTMFRPAVARVTAPLYAVSEGFVLGGVSAMFNAVYPGIVLEAVGVTGAVAGVVYLMYATGIVKVTNKVRNIIVAATFGVLVFYVVAFVVSLFTHSNILYSGGWLGIEITVVIAGVAAANLLLDFAFIDQAVAARVARSMEWFAAFGVTVTLVWLYMTVLRLLRMLR